MSKTKLLPCPFCGGEALLDREDIFCDACHLFMRIDDRLYNGEAEKYEEAKKQAIEAWNTRKPIEDIVAKLDVEVKNSDKRASNEANVNGHNLDYECFYGQRMAYLRAR